METSPFVGRNPEIASLMQWLSATSSGQPLIVFVSGEAGVGKSRLINEFLLAAGRSHHNLISAIGYCNSYFGHSDTLHPVRQIFTQLFEQEKIDQSLSKTQQITAKFKEWAWELAPDVIGAFIPLAAPAIKLAQLAGKGAFPKKLSVADNDEEARTVMFEQLTRLLFRVAQDAPLALILEDLHWVDEATLDFIFHIARSWKSERLLIICTYRPDEIATLTPEHPFLQIKRELVRYNLCQEIDLGWLNEKSLENWLSDLYPINQFPNSFAHWLFERTEGNALFTSEILKDLQERHLLYPNQDKIWVLSKEVQSVENLPKTIIAVLDQRLARLEKKFLDILTCASVEGEEFTSEVISTVRQLENDHVVDSLIDTMGRKMDLVLYKEERQLINRRWLSLFAFRHSLMQEFIYGTLAEPQRRRLHQQVGECLELLYDGTLEEISLALSRHFSLAGNSEKALKYSLMAASRAEKAFDFKSTRQWLLVAVDHIPNSTISSLAKADIWHRLGHAEIFVGSFEKANICFNQAVNYLDQTEISKRADILLDWGYSNIQTGNITSAIEFLEEAIKLNSQIDRMKEIAYCMTRLAFAHHKADNQALYKEYLFQAKNKFEELGDENGQAITYRHLGIYFRGKKDFEKSIEYLQKAVFIDHKREDKFEEASDYTNIGSAYLNLRNDENQALTYYKKGLELSRQVSKVREEGHLLLNIARLYALKRDWQSALDNAEEGLRLCETVKQTSNVVRGLMYCGIIKFHMGKVENALADYEHALNIGQIDAKTKWGVLYNLASIQEQSGLINDAFNTYLKVINLLLEITQKQSKDEQLEYIMSEDKLNTFRATQALAKHLNRHDEINSILNTFPLIVNKLTNEDVLPPKFYWGGGKWM